MAKKKDQEKENKKEKGKFGGKILAFIIILFILFIWLAIFAVIIRLDVGGLGTTLRPALKNVPIISMVLPKVSDEQLAYEENYPYNDMTEAVNTIKELEMQIDALNAANVDSNKKNTELSSEVERLKVFEEKQLAFDERVKEFDKNVVFNSNAPELEEYKTYYEEINPTTAEEIYRIVTESLQYDKQILEKATILKNMKPAQAANVLSEMTADIEWATKVLLSMKPAESSAIINKMDTIYAAKLFKKMADMDEERYNAIMGSMQ